MHAIRTLFALYILYTTQFLVLCSSSMLERIMDAVSAIYKLNACHSTDLLLEIIIILII